MTEVNEKLQIEYKEGIHASNSILDENCFYVLKIVMLYFVLFIGKRLISTILNKFSKIKNTLTVRKK
jgi:hypothetical protein